eukprot:Skav212499  [mRNA]  locus=scaffold5109:13381:17989:- [translate_table: standard]
MSLIAPGHGVGWVPSEGTRLPEKRLNRSVLAVQEVIQALARRESFIPYRNGKLTHWLRYALCGRALLRVLATASPVDQEETQRTLRFAANARQLQSFVQAWDWDEGARGPTVLNHRGAGHRGRLCSGAEKEAAPLR